MDMDPAVTGLRRLSCSPEPSKGRRLETADTVVVGGAGLGSTEGFGLVRELAAALGGEVGATRPPVLAHWVEEDRMIGQTGKTVRPDLLFSIGTSGAIQYTAGIAEAGTVVAINRDPKAPSRTGVGVRRAIRNNLNHILELPARGLLHRDHVVIVLLPAGDDLNLLIWPVLLQAS